MVNNVEVFLKKSLPGDSAKNITKEKEWLATYRPDQRCTIFNPNAKIALPKYAYQFYVLEKQHTDS